MKNYSSKTKGSYLQNYKYHQLIKVVFFVLLALISIRMLSGSIAVLASFVTTPIAEIRTYFQNSGAVLPVYVRDRNELIKSIDELKGELASHSGDTATIERLTLENNELRTLLGDHGESRMVAGVIGRPPESPYDTLYLDKGENDGIQEEAIVYHADDQAIGFVQSVFPGSALVQLFSSAGTEFTAYVFGPNVYVHGYGEGGGVIRLSIPQGIIVQEGNVVVLPSVVPGTIGVVEKVVSVATQPEQHAYVVMKTPIQSLRYVGVQNDVATPITFEEAQARVDAHKSELFMISVPEDFEALVSTTSTTTNEATERTQME